MSVFLVECPACSCRIPVDSETMRVVGEPATHWVKHRDLFALSDAERAARLAELEDRRDRCNQEPEGAA